MNFPDKLLSLIDDLHVDFALSSEIMGAVIFYIRFGSLPQDICPKARMLFIEHIRVELDKILLRRRRAAEYRRRRKLALSHDSGKDVSAPVKIDSPMHTEVETSQLPAPKQSASAPNKKPDKSPTKRKSDSQKSGAKFNISRIKKRAYDLHHKNQSLRRT